MPLESLQLSVVLNASPEEIFSAWLDPRLHGSITGSPAEVDPVVGGRHAAWDGYITGKNLVLEAGRRIVQSWRTTEFPPEAGDSRLELELVPVENGTELRLAHTEIPDGQGRSYEQGWVEYYLEPMKRHFASQLRARPALTAVPPPAEPAKKAAPAKKVASPKKAAPTKKAAKKPAVARKPAKKPAAKKAAAKKPAAKKAAPKKAARRPVKKAQAPRKPARQAKPARKPAAKKGKRR